MTYGSLQVIAEGRQKIGFFLAVRREPDEYSLGIVQKINAQVAQFGHCQVKGKSAVRWIFASRLRIVVSPFNEQIPLFDEGQRDGEDKMRICSGMELGQLKELESSEYLAGALSYALGGAEAVRHFEKGCLESLDGTVFIAFGEKVFQVQAEIVDESFEDRAAVLVADAALLQGEKTL